MTVLQRPTSQLSSSCVYTSLEILCSWTYSWLFCLPTSTKVKTMMIMLTWRTQILRMKRILWWCFGCGWGSDLPTASQSTWRRHLQLNSLVPVVVVVARVKVKREGGWLGKCSILTVVKWRRHRIKWIVLLVKCSRYGRSRKRRDRTWLYRINQKMLKRKKEAIANRTSPQGSNRN